MERDDAFMLTILPVTYLIVDLLRPVPGVWSWMLPIAAAITGMILGVLWAIAQDNTSSEQIMIHAAVGFGFGAGATGANQIPNQIQNKDAT